MTQIRLGTPGDAARERELWQLAFGDDGAYVDNFYQTYYKPERMLLLEEDGVVRFPDAPTLRGVKHLEELAAAQPQPQPELPAAGEEAEESPEEGENSQAALIMAHVRRYLEDNYMFDLSLDSVGEILHISPAYLSAQFKKYQKMNFLDCLTELRINAAKELLADPFRSSAEVASMVGYEDASYFARAFKKRTGMTPTQYRRQAGQKAKADPEAGL